MHRTWCWVRGAAAALVWITGAVQAGTVTVVTSLSQEMVESYRKSFTQLHPDVNLDIVAKNTTELLRYLQQVPAQQRPDVVWASSLDAFEVLARQQLLQPALEVRNRQAPDKIGRYQLNEPKGLYFGQSLAGGGIMWNTDYLRQRQLPAPSQWQDLAQPQYHGHLALSSPLRSGTMHMMVESILQSEGWDKGWALILQIAGNASEVVSDSYGVPRGVVHGKYGLGMVIDAFGMAAKQSGLPVDFAYPTMSPLLPVSIGLIAGARNPLDAKRFMAFTLSQQGQQLLLDKRITRLPVLPAATLPLPAGYPDVYAVAQRSKLQFDSRLSSVRYGVVGQLFEQMVSLPIADLRAATAAIQAAEQALQQKSNAAARGWLSQARQLAYAPVLSVEASRDPQWLAKLQPGASNSPGVGVLVWQEMARSNYRRATMLAQQALASAQGLAPKRP